MDVLNFFPKDSFSGKTVFITGGGSGINLGIAKNFAVLGAKLAICSRSKERLDNAKIELEDLGAEVLAVSADVRDYVAVIEALEDCSETLGNIDVLICGAAGNFPCAAKDLSANGFRTVVDIDLMGTFNTMHAAFGQLKKTKGCAIFISAGQSQIPYEMQAHVGAAKAGVDNLMKNLALEWGRYGIRVNSILPGPIADTLGFEKLVPDEISQELQNTIPLKKFGHVDDIGQAAVFLASPLASFITGTVLRVDGGHNLQGSGLFFHLVREHAKSQKGKDVK